MHLIRGLARDLLAGLPGGLETALMVREAVLPLPASLRPGRSFRLWLNDLDGESANNGFPSPTTSPPASSFEPRRVLFFACEPHWLNVSLATAAVLIGRGCHVDFAYLPYSRIEGEETTAAMKAFQVNYGRFLTDECHPRLRFFDLRRCEVEPLSDELVEGAKEQSLSDTKHALKREEIDLEREARHGRTYQFRLRRNLECMARLSSLLRHAAYDVVVVPNGNSRQFGAAFRLARSVSLKVVSFEFGERLEAAVISPDVPCTAMDTSAEWSDDDPHIVTPAVRERIERLIATRRSTDWTGFAATCQRSGFEADAERVLSRLRIPRDGRRTVLLCPNVAWDSALLGRDRAFPTLAEWVRATAAFFAAREDARLIVRVHPAETMIGTGEPVAAMVREAVPDMPDHVRVVHSDEAVNTYDLMEVCDFGLVYNSTTGLEMALRGMPTVAAARPHYAGKGFTVDVETRQEYVGALETMLARPAGLRLSPRQTELAWCYADVYFFRWPKPFPWCLSSFWEDVARWPIGRVLSEEGRARFGRSFDLLVNRS